jgi:phosphatidylethanolamine N-methyltransferase
MPFLVRPVPADDMDLIKVTLMDYVQRCYYRDAELMPINEDDELVSLNDQRAKRIAHGIKLMYGISFHAAVIQMDGTVARLARRIWEAKCALAPFKPVCFKVHTE